MKTKQEWIDHLSSCVDPNVRLYFWFADGTGFYGYAEEFAAYAVRRYKVYPDQAFEIEKPWAGDIPNCSFEIYPPTEDGDEFTKDNRDWRFAEDREGCNEQSQNIFAMVKTSKGKD